MSPQRWGYDINHQRTLGVYAHTSTGLPFLQPYSLYRSQSPLLGSLPLSIRLLAGLLTFPFVLSRVFPQVFSLRAFAKRFSVSSLLAVTWFWKHYPIILMALGLQQRDCSGLTPDSLLISLSRKPTHVVSCFSIKSRKNNMFFVFKQI